MAARRSLVPDVLPAAGWVAAGETWVYAGADDPTYTFTIAGVDRTSKYSAGMRLRLSQATGGTKYFVVTKVAFSTDTTVTVYGGTDYDLANETISSPFWSPVKAPLGFPLDPSKWTVSLTDTSVRSQAATNGTWYNLGSLSVSLPLGIWDLRWRWNAGVTRGSSNYCDLITGLSTADNSLSDTETASQAVNSTGVEITITASGAKTLVLAAKTTYYIVAVTQSSGNTLRLYPTYACPTMVRAVCAYL